MRLLDIAKELARLAGYSITGTDSQSVSDKAKAVLRVNSIRADIISRFSGKWAGQYREGWLPLVPVYSTGTIAVTQGSRTVTGTGTTFTSSMIGRKFLGPDNAYYKIIGYTSSTVLLLSEPYQGATVVSDGVYQIWKDEYVLYPDVFSVIDFVNYVYPSQMSEHTNKYSRALVLLGLTISSLVTKSRLEVTPIMWTQLTATPKSHWLKTLWLPCQL
jgi:hypothetical protein